MKQVRREWTNSAGSPGPVGVELNVTVSDTQRHKTQYQIRGVVDVPSEPLNDDERHFLANLLFHRTDIPQKECRGVQLVDWYICSGGDGVRIHRCGPIPTLTQKDIIGEVKIFRSPEVEGLDEDSPYGIEEHNKWRHEYQDNQYCRFESREDLHQRLQDVFVNTVVLTSAGKLRLTHEAKWYRLSQHIIDELLMRGQPLSEQNFDPRVERAQVFRDGDLCRKAAKVVSGAELGHDVIVKYGKYSHMRELYEKGVVWINPASVYDIPSHNQAIRDNERVFVFKGGYSPKGETNQFYNGDTIPEDIEGLVRDKKAEFTSIFNAPTLKRHEYAKVEVRSPTDYWLYCVAGALEQRLFSDFDADACVVIRKEPFLQRLAWMSQLVLRNVNMYFEKVKYEDPLGAIEPKRHSHKASTTPVFLTKLFRYSYQREFRFVCLPRRPEEKLSPVQIKLGSIADISELLVL